MIKKITLLLTILLCTTATLLAQDSKKYAVLLDNFSHPAGVTRQECEMVRTAFLAGLTQSGRLSVVDVANVQARELSENHNETPSIENISRQFMEQTGGTRLISATVTNVDAVRKRDSDGDTYYSGIVVFSVNIIDLTTGNSIAGERYNFSDYSAKSGDTYDEAVVNTMSSVQNAVEKLVDAHFKVQTKILQIEETAGKKAKSLYINIGSSMGIEPGQIFLVYYTQNIAGVESRKEVGKISVKEVNGAEISLCRVANGGDQILELYNKGIELKVESAGKTFFSGFFQ